MANFKIGNTDFGGHVIAGTYSVSNDVIYKVWTDGNGHNHRTPKRSKMQGSFDMFFRTMEQYQSFIAAIEASKTANVNSYVSATLTDNISNADIESKYYLDFKPVRNRDANWKDYFETFTVTVEEF